MKYLFLFFLSLNSMAAENSEVDYAAIADLNHQAEQVWQELNKTGIQSNEYLNPQHPFTAEQIAKVRDLKQSLQMLTNSGPINVNSISQRTEFMLTPSNFKPPLLNLHPFLSQLLIENLLLEISRGWANERSFQSFEEAHMILSCYNDNSIYYCKYMRPNKAREAAIKSFANSLLLLAIFVKNECPMAGFDTKWTKNAVTAALDRHYLISQGNWASKLSLSLVLKNAGCGSDSEMDLKKFARDYNSLQAKFLR